MGPTIEETVLALSRPEKARLLGLLVRDVGDLAIGIESTPGVCGGDPDDHQRPSFGSTG